VAFAQPPSYRSLLQRTETDYPPAFADAAPLLLRILAQSSDIRVAWWKRWLLPLGLHKLALRGQFARPGVRNADVLVTFFPARVDYRGLLLPAVETMIDRGARLLVALPPAIVAQDRAFGSATTFDLWAMASPGAYKSALERYRQLTSSIHAFATEWRLDGAQTASTKILFQGYCWQLELLAAALERSKPSAVLGLHYVENPGFIGALREHHDGSGNRAETFLLQHGVFSHAWGIHDFGGADKVLIWGPQSQREMAAFQDNAPPSTVVGYPRLQARAGEFQFEHHGQGGRVLVLGTNDLPERQLEALQLIAEGLPETEDRKVTYRPHPSEPAATYKSLVACGLLREQQIRRGGSLYEALAAADVVVGTTSTALPEAVNLGVPAIQVLPERFEFQWGVGAMATASSSEALTQVVDSVLRNPAERSALLERESMLARDLLGEPDGAAQRIADAVLEQFAQRRARRDS